MKKTIAILLALMFALSLTACRKKAKPAETPAAEAPAAEAAAPTVEAAPPEEAAPAEEPAQAEETAPAVMSYADFVAADLDTPVVVETYVQDKQSWWDNKATVYTQNEDGAYFLYNMTCSEEDYASLVPGTKIKVSGFKAEWSGEVEIVDATFEIEEGNYIAEALDVTDLLGTDELIAHQNQLVAFKGMTVEDYGDGNAFAYKNEADKTDDLYFKVSKDGSIYDFCVEFYLRGQDSDVYKAVEALQIGDVVDLEGFLYWYEGANPHIISVTPAEEAAPAGEAMVGMPNPWSETDDAAEAVAGAGLGTLPVANLIPQKIFGLELQGFRYMEGIVEADYANADSEAYFRVSKDYSGIEGLAGDYNAYSQAWTASFAGMNLEARGGQNRVNVAAFDAAGMHFAVGYNTGTEGAGVPINAVEVLAAKIQIPDAILKLIKK